MKRSALFAILLHSIIVLGFAQQTPTLNEGRAMMVNFSYGYKVPGADLKERFGGSGALHSGVEFWTKNSVILGVEGFFQFGTNVKEDVLSTLRTEEGFIISTDRQVADIQLGQRGFYVGGLMGKHFSIDPSNERSGIRLTLGAGLLQHKIRIQDDPSVVVAQLSPTYKKGYDRLTNGLALSQFIGYQVLAKNRQFNFTIGADFMQGFTQNRRAYNFDTRMRDTSERLDLLWGLRATLTLPFYLEASKGTEQIIY